MLTVGEPREGGRETASARTSVHQFHGEKNALHRGSGCWEPPLWVLVAPAVFPGIRGREGRGRDSSQRLVGEGTGRRGAAGVETTPRLTN